MDVNDVYFYGAGPASEKHTRDPYTYEPLEAGMNATVRPWRYLALSGGYSFLDFETNRGTPIFSPAQMPGIDRALTFHVTRASATFDWRTTPGYSTKGGYYRAAYERHHETDGDPFSFHSQEYEISQLVPLVREQFVFAARGLVTLSTPDNGHQVPVVLAPFLGSGSTLRGFSNRRFVDRNRIVLSGEYRWRPSRYLDMALFVDAGQVAHDRRDFSFGNFETDWGLGARLHGAYFTALRVEAAHGREGTRLVFAASQAF